MKTLMHKNTQTLKHSNIIVSVFLCFCVSVFMFWLPQTASAALDLGGATVKKAATGAGYAASTGQTTLAETVGTVIKTILSVMGVLFMTLMVYAGYLWMNARGDEAQITKAQDIIRAAVIGLIIIIAAYSITNFVVPKVLERATGQGGGGTTVGG